MEGPTISRPAGNETSPLFELSEAFRHCVRLSIAPQFYSNVKLQQPVSTVVEPYPLSNRPYLVLEEESHQNEPTPTNDQMSGENLDFVESNARLLEHSNTNVTEKSTNPTSSITKRLLFAANPINGAKALISLVVPTLQESQRLVAKTPDYVAITPSLASYYVKKALNWKKGEDEKSSIEAGTSNEAF